MRRLALLMLAGCGARSAAEVTADAEPATPAPDATPIATDATRSLVLPAVDATPAVSMRLLPTGAPCFPDRASVPAMVLMTGLWADEGGIARRVGECRYVQVGELDTAYWIVRTPDGRDVASVSCGLNVGAPGLVDDHGVGVGARGRTVLARHGPDAGERLLCMPTYQETRPRRIACWMPVPEGGDADRLWIYVVEGRLTEPVVGDAAIALFAPRRVVALQHRGSCH